jgi:hypothetical protein
MHPRPGYPAGEAAWEDFNPRRQYRRGKWDRGASCDHFGSLSPSSRPASSALRLVGARSRRRMTYRWAAQLPGRRGLAGTRRVTDIYLMFAQRSCVERTCHEHHHPQPLEGRKLVQVETIVVSPDGKTWTATRSRESGSMRISAIATGLPRHKCGISRICLPPSWRLCTPEN